MSLFSKSKRGSLGVESTTSPIPPTPVQHTRFSVASGLRGRDDALRMTQDMEVESSRDPESVAGDIGNRTMMEDFEDEDDVSLDDSRSDSTFRSRSKLKDPSVTNSSSSVPLHPGTIMGKHKPSLQCLEDLPGLSVVTWEEFLDSPSVLCGLFEADRAEFIHYNSEQVNVFFQDSRMEHPTLGAPSGDGQSWTIFIDNYNHLKAVRNWLTGRVSVILLSLLKTKGQDKAACLVAINPKDKEVGAQLNNSFARATDAFLKHKNFCIEIDLNDCVRKWCRSALNMPCTVTGGRLVITNADDRVPCSRVDNVPFCVFCFPVWGIQKLSYKFKRRSEYEDVFISFKVEDISLCTKSSILKQHADEKIKSSTAASSTTSSGDQKPRKWIKRNQHAVTVTTQTTVTGHGANGRAHLKIEEVENAGEGQDKRRAKRHNSKRDTERGQDSGFSSDSTSTEKCESQLISSLPSYRPHNFVPPRPSDKTKRVSRDQSTTTRKNLDDTSSVSASTSHSSSAGYGNLMATDPTPKSGAQVKPGPCISWQVLQDVDEDDDGIFRVTPRDSAPAGSRDAGFGSTLPAVGFDEEPGTYTLFEGTSSPRPDTPLYKQQAIKSLKGRRALMMTQDAIIKEEGLDTDRTISTEEKPKLSKHVALMSRDLSFSSPAERHSSPRVNVTDTPREENDFFARDNKAFASGESQDGAFKNLKNNEKMKLHPIKSFKDKKNASQKAFPYTSEYLDFKSGNKPTTYDLVNQEGVRGAEVKEKKKQPAVAPHGSDMLFAPRHILSENPDERNPMSEDGMNDKDVKDMDDDIVSDIEEADSHQMEPARHAAQTASMDADQQQRSDANKWEITECDLDEAVEIEDSPRVLPGVKGAQQLRSTKDAPGASSEARRRGGGQYDSRRKYIALNSLRRKTNQSALQADVRKQIRPEIPASAADLIEF